MNDIQSEPTSASNRAESKPAPTLNLKFISHGTLETADIDASRKFYEEFMGFEVIRTSKVSLWLRLGGQHTYVVVQVPPDKHVEMNFMNHNGVDVETEDLVDECYQLALRDAEKWKLTKISKPGVQHGTYSFYFFDADGNAWEILANPPGGYSWMFERGDQEGMGHWSKKFERPAVTRRKTDGVKG